LNRRLSSQHQFFEHKRQLTPRRECPLQRRHFGTVTDRSATRLAVIK
jgi:hypothetical protein